MCIAWKYFKQQAIAEGERKGLRKGLAKGRKEGREAGREEIQKKVALEALQLNLDYDTIQKLTGFTEEEIREIAVSARA